MQWIRTNRRFGAWCALAAIALHLVLSFGHAHRIDVPNPDVADQTAGVQTAVERGVPASKAALAIEYCAICAAIKMGAATVPLETPVSGVPVVGGGVRLTPRAEAAAWTLAHRLFQARAPPPA
jgi:hypothetical protein